MLQETKKITASIPSFLSLRANWPENKIYKQTADQYVIYFDLTGSSSVWIFISFSDYIFFRTEGVISMVIHCKCYKCYKRC